MKMGQGHKNLIITWFVQMMSMQTDGNLQYHIFCENLTSSVFVSTLRSLHPWDKGKWGYGHQSQILSLD